MKYVLYNIRNLAKHEKFIFAVMLVCVFVSAWIMTFSYGLYQNFNAKIEEEDEEGKRAYPEIVEGESITYEELKFYLDALPEELLNSADIIACHTFIGFEDGITGETAYATVNSRFTVRNGNYQASSYLAELWASLGMMVSGSYFSDDDEMYGNACVMVADRYMTDPYERERHAPLMLDDNTVLMFGKEYKIIGIASFGWGYNVPFLSVPVASEVGRINIQFKRTMTNKMYQTLIDTANEVLPGKLSFPELELPDKNDIYIYHNIMLISVFIAALTIVNFAFLYNFIFSKRKRQLAIMRICGCTAGRAVRICLGECIILCVPVFIAGMLTYIPFMKYVLSPLFEYMEESYSLWIYTAIFGIYIVMLLIIMGILLSGQIRKTLAESRKEVT